jgi:hypothetical protein
MKITILSLSLILSAFASFAQDLIVTSRGDSINCMITGFREKYIFFKYAEEKEVKHTMLPREDVVNYEYNFYDTPILEEEEKAGPANYRQFRVAANGGFSYFTAKVNDQIPSDFDDYFKDLKWGYHFGADFSYFLSEKFGLGLRYSLFRTSNSMDDVYVDDGNGNIRTGKMSDDISTQLFAPFFSIRLNNNSYTGAFLMGMSLGYIGYSNNAQLIDPMKLTGNVFGLSLEMGYDIGLSDNLFLGFQVSFLMGALSKITMDNANGTQTIELEEGNHESMSRLDLSAGLRFSK